MCQVLAFAPFKKPSSPFLAGVDGFEPPMCGSEPHALPLGDTPKTFLVAAFQAARFRRSRVLSRLALPQKNSEQYKVSAPQSQWRIRVMIDKSAHIPYNVITLLGRRQAVRHQTLTLTRGGSNPSAPATQFDIWTTKGGIIKSVFFNAFF